MMLEDPRDPSEDGEATNPGPNEPDVVAPELPSDVPAPSDPSEQGSG